jgi:hypothetical protein
LKGGVRTLSESRPLKYATYRSGKPLRHPKANAKTLGGRYRGIPPLRKKRARMGHPSDEMIAAKILVFQHPVNPHLFKPLQTAPLRYFIV